MVICAVSNTNTNTRSGTVMKSAVGRASAPPQAQLRGEKLKHVKGSAIPRPVCSAVQQRIGCIPPAIPDAACQHPNVMGVPHQAVIPLIAIGFNGWDRDGIGRHAY